MKLKEIDLNLLVYLDVLLREKNVTRAAAQLGITQSAASNSLRRLRKLFGDPLLVRGSLGMIPTEYAVTLHTDVQKVLDDVTRLLTPKQDFRPYSTRRVFRIMASDYALATLIPRLVKALRSEAPNVIMDFLTPSDVSHLDMEQARIDLAINPFYELPQSFHQTTLWQDSYSCLIVANSAHAYRFNLKNYLAAPHIWVSKTDMGAGFGVNPNKSAALGAIDEALLRIGQTRHISVFTRHYQISALLLANPDLIATLPTKVAHQQVKASNGALLLKPPPFYVNDFALQMAWSPLLQHNRAHEWLRQLIAHTARQMAAEGENQHSK